MAVDATGKTKIYRHSNMAPTKMHKRPTKTTTPEQKKEQAEIYGFYPFLLVFWQEFSPWFLLRVIRWSIYQAKNAARSPSKHHLWLDNMHLEDPTPWPLEIPGVSEKEDNWVGQWVNGSEETWQILSVAIVVCILFDTWHLFFKLSKPDVLYISLYTRVPLQSSRLLLCLNLCKPSHISCVINSAVYIIIPINHEQQTITACLAPRMGFTLFCGQCARRLRLLLLRRCKRQLIQWKPGVWNSKIHSMLSF